jgi:hypothetical protein
MIWRLCELCGGVFTKRDYSTCSFMQTKAVVIVIVVSSKLQKWVFFFFCTFICEVMLHP